MVQLEGQLSQYQYQLDLYVVHTGEAPRAPPPRAQTTPSSMLHTMFVVVTQGMQIRILPGSKSWFADFRLEIRRFEF